MVKQKSLQMTILISPAERDPRLLALGKVSGIPESIGADFAWLHKGEFTGIQRKSQVDMRASLHDGRLVKEVSQMQDDGISLAILIIEGHNRYTSDGQLFSEQERWTEAQQQGILLSIQLRGIFILYTDDIPGTARTIQAVYAWSKKEKHNSLDRRVGPRSKWVKIDGRDERLHVIQGFKGISIGTSESIYRECQGRVPLQWAINGTRLTQKDLEGFTGIGKTRAKNMWDVLNIPGELE